MTCMDMWLLLCMGFVLLALGEYAVILRIRFPRNSEPYEKLKGKRETDLKKKCSNIDSWALKIFMGLNMFVVGIYFYCVYSYE